jgi:hypothetical protein
VNGSSPLRIFIVKCAAQRHDHSGQASTGKRGLESRSFQQIILLTAGNNGENLLQKVTQTLAKLKGSKHDREIPFLDYL